MFQSKHTKQLLVFLTYLANKYFADFLNFLKM